MVYNVPSVKVSHTYGYVPSIPADDQIFGLVVEGTKGSPHVPVLIRTPEQLYQRFKVKLNAYFGVGGQAIYVTRAACDADNGGAAPTKASQILLDTSGTALEVLKLEAKEQGSYPINLSVSPNSTSGNNVIIEEEGYAPEYYIGITGIRNLVNRINRESDIVDAFYYVCPIGEPNCVDGTWAKAFSAETQVMKEGNGILTTVLPGTVLGELPIGGDADLYVAGSDGTTEASPDYAGQIPDSNAATAHAKALASLEMYKLAGVFTTQVTTGSAAAVHAKYIEHVDAMNQANVHGWRFAILGAPEGAAKSEILSAAVGINRETIAYQGQGCIDMNGIEYTPTEATQVIAGKIGGTRYQDAIWGGKIDKILGIVRNGVVDKFITGLVRMPGEGPDGFATHEDTIEYNEAGVLTFVEEIDGMRIREGLTTAQNPAETAEDELAVMRIIRHVKYLVYDRCYEMLGQNMTSTFKTDLEENIKTGLEKLKTEDRSIIDIPDSGLSAYTVSVMLVPRTVQKQGKVTVNVSVTPVHAAREIEATVVVM
ncbi:MAG: hypothetical protein Q8N08_04035 [Methanobacteriaceae archaeon]|nr:hypothetical protein [Methanobacteriaceae archaeon]